MLNKLISSLNVHGAKVIKAVDISDLSANENRGFNIALLIGIPLSQDYISRLTKENIKDNSEFSEKERITDELAEWTADFIIAKGYKAYAQSEKILIADGFYNEITKTALLPHKTIALRTGLGWIGKNNLLITPDYGSALCICTVLTDAPFSPENKPILLPKCGVCSICVDICPTKALSGTVWKIGIARDLMLDLYQCNMCLKCLVYCPWTRKYMKRNQTAKKCNE
jgi:epoxyqueuosine reductase